MIVEKQIHPKKALFGVHFGLEVLALNGVRYREVITNFLVPKLQNILFIFWSCYFTLSISVLAAKTLRFHAIIDFFLLLFF